MSPETQTHTFCELFFLKFTWRSHTSQVIPKFTGKMPHPPPRIEPRTRTHTLREPAPLKCNSRFHNSHAKFTGKMPQTKMSPERGHTFCATLRSRKACQDFTRATLWRKFTGKMPRSRMNPERRQTFCASLRSRNASQDFTGGTFCRNLQVKGRRPEWAPWSSTGL